MLQTEHGVIHVLEYIINVSSILDIWMFRQLTEPNSSLLIQTHLCEQTFNMLAKSGITDLFLWTQLMILKEVSYKAKTAFPCVKETSLKYIYVHNKL